MNWIFYGEKKHTYHAQIVRKHSIQDRFNLKLLGYWDKVHQTKEIKQKEKISHKQRTSLKEAVSHCLQKA